MKKLSKILFLTLFSFLLFSCGKQVTEEEAAQALSKYLVKEYGEEFEIGGIMRTQTPNGEEYFEADIILSRYYNNGQDDEYFWRLGQVAIEKSPFGEKIKYATDTYGIVRVNLSANEYFMPKLEELFGKQVLPIFQINTSKVSRDGDFIKTMELNEHATIGGGIYLFGRINDLEQKEIYREKIFEFIQYMKEKGLFEYVDLAFLVIDDRVLTKEFQDNSTLIKELETLGNSYRDNNLTFFREKRKEFMEKLPDKLNYTLKIDDISRDKIKDSVAWSNYNNLLTMDIHSEKYIHQHSLESFVEKYNYEFLENMYIRYREYF